MWPLGQIAALLPTSCVPSACRPPSEIPCRGRKSRFPGCGGSLGEDGKMPSFPPQALGQRAAAFSPIGGTQGVRTVSPGAQPGDPLTRTDPTSSCGNNRLTLMAAVLEEATRADTAVTNGLSCLYTNTFVSSRGGERKGTRGALMSETRSH